MPDDWDVPVSATSNWPRVVQIAWVLLDIDRGTPLESVSCLVQPNGFTIPADAEEVHGISTERARREGSPLPQVLERFSGALARADCLVAHNVNFDTKVVGAEYVRQGHADPVAPKPSRCTMTESTDYCQLPGRYGYKWPTLQELHEKLFAERFEDAHDAATDVRACTRCYLALRERGVMNEP